MLNNMRIRAGLLSMLVFMCAVPAHAVTLLSENWEGTCEEVAARWSDSYSASPQTEQFPCGTGTNYFGDASHQPFFLDSGTKLFGANSLRYSFTGTQYQVPRQGGGYADKNFSQKSTEIWITFYNRFSAGFQTAGGAIGGSATKGPYNFMISDTRCVINNASHNPATCGSAGASLQQNLKIGVRHRLPRRITARKSRTSPNSACVPSVRRSSRRSHWPAPRHPPCRSGG